MYALVLSENLFANYLAKDEVTPGVKGDKSAEVLSDITANFIVLAAIYFPSVTGTVNINAFALLEYMVFREFLIYLLFCLEQQVKICLHVMSPTLYPRKSPSKFNIVC